MPFMISIYLLPDYVLYEKALPFSELTNDCYIFPHVELF